MNIDDTWAPVRTEWDRPRREQVALARRHRARVVSALLAREKASAFVSVVTGGDDLWTLRLGMDVPELVTWVNGLGPAPPERRRAIDEIAKELGL